MTGPTALLRGGRLPLQARVRLVEPAANTPEPLTTRQGQLSPPPAARYPARRA